MFNEDVIDISLRLQYSYLSWCSYYCCVTQVLSGGNCRRRINKNIHKITMHFRGNQRKLYAVTSVSSNIWLKQLFLLILIIGTYAFRNGSFVGKSHMPLNFDRLNSFYHLYGHCSNRRKSPSILLPSVSFYTCPCNKASSARSVTIHQASRLCTIERVMDLKLSLVTPQSDITQQITDCRPYGTR